MSHQDCNDPAMVSDDSVVVASSSSSSPGFTNNKELKRLDEIQSSSLSNDSNDGGPDDDDDDDEIDDYDCDIHQRKDPAHIIQRSESVIKSPSKLAAPTPVIQVIDTASGPSANTDGDNQKKYSSPPPSICSPSSSSNGANFLLSSNIAPNNPFLRATSFHQNSSLSSIAFIIEVIKWIFIILIIIAIDCVFVYCITHHTTTTSDDDDDDDDDVELTRNDQEKRKIHSKKKMVNNERSYLIILNVKTHTHTECDHIFLFCWLIFSHIIMIHMIILIVSSGPFEPKKKQKTNSDS